LVPAICCRHQGHQLCLESIMFGKPSLKCFGIVCPVNIPARKFVEGVIWQKSPNMILSWIKLNFYHKIGLLKTFGVKKTTLVAWVGVHPLFLAYFGIDSACAPHHEPIKAPFTSRTPPVYFFYVAHWYWMLKSRLEGVGFDPFWHPFCCFFSKGFLLQWCLFFTRATKHQKSCNLVQWLIWCGHLAVKRRVHAAAHCAWAPWRKPFKCYEKLESRATIQY